MKTGDLIVFRPKSGSIHDTMLGLLIKKTTFGDTSKNGPYTDLFDVMFEDEIITISDVYFEISKLQEKA
jgi:hypothetical protein